MLPFLTLSKSNSILTFMEQTESKTLKKILKVAAAEFSKHGFKDASLREIVKKAGVTTGAFYGYFKSKEELFDALVKEHADTVLKIYDDVLEEFQKLSFEKQRASMESFSSVGIHRMFEYVWNHKEPFHLIASASAGTRYENFIGDITKRDLNSTENFYGVLESMGKKVERVDILIEEMVIKSTFSLFFELILKDLPKEEVEHGLSQLFDFYRGGWNNLMHFAE